MANFVHFTNKTRILWAKEKKKKAKVMSQIDGLITTTKITTKLADINVEREKDGKEPLLISEHVMRELERIFPVVCRSYVENKRGEPSIVKREGKKVMKTSFFQWAATNLPKEICDDAMKLLAEK